MDVIIGKYTLESLTTGMYKDPFILYREYIQNSTDSIDESIEKGIQISGEERIKIIVDNSEREITIEDNGTGIESTNAYKILTDIGNSKKKYTSHKGFRGIGRLGGISYCEKLIFETSYIGEDVKTIIEFDSNRLKQLLVPGTYESYTMVDVIKEITSQKLEKEDIERHYFKVILKGVSDRYKLLDLDKVENYLCQVAPVPFNKKFQLGDRIKEELKKLKLKVDEYNIWLGRNEDELVQIFKPYKKRFYADISRKIEDEIEDIKFKVITNDYLNKVVAVVWYGQSNLWGTIVDEKVKGLRVKKSGILIGDRFLLNDIFKEERFNGWIQGEVLIFDDKIIPNARRDDFEKNEEYLFLMEKLKEVAADINNEIRIVSKVRNQKKNINQLEQMSLCDIKTEDFNEEKDINVSQKENVDDDFEMLFDQLDEESNNEKGMLQKIEEILIQELDEKCTNKIMKRIEEIFKDI